MDSGEGATSAKQVTTMCSHDSIIEQMFYSVKRELLMEVVNNLGEERSTIPSMSPQRHGGARRMRKCHG
jgi:hypothetical protein